MWTRNACKALEILRIKYPIIQAPMAGVTTPVLVANASNGGGLGSLPAGYSSSEMFLKDIIATQELTNKPFSANLFIPASINDKGLAQKRVRMNEHLNIYREKLNISLINPSIPSIHSIDELLDIIIERNIPIVSFTFGILAPKQIQRLKQLDILLIGTATTVKEAQSIEANGCDMVIAQGYEAGGHRGTFLGSFETSMIGTMTLVPQIVDSVRIPVIAAGGIMDGRGISAALKLEASAVQMGTAFLRCPESGTSTAYKDAISTSNEESTVITSAFSGKPARGIKNEFIVDMEKNLQDILPYPEQHYLTAPIRQAATQKNLLQYMSLWAGQGARFSQALPADELMKKFADETLHRLYR